MKLHRGEMLFSLRWFRCFLHFHRCAILRRCTVVKPNEQDSEGAEQGERRLLTHVVVDDEENNPR